ncbi:MAG: hypothetical protein M1823_002175 [Watsoniomyces obsoletus]|nr:MAG: hypothetical protein M1823_002175 [Watsoniomyces obsoletus]
MRSFTWMLLASATALVGARPMPDNDNDRDGDDYQYDLDSTKWAPPVRNYYESIGKKVAVIRDLPSFPNPPPCDLSKAVMPTAPTPLPPPGPGLKLAHVVIGRGTQNYTCANNSATTKPVAVGAVANLYNVSCLAATSPDALTYLSSSSLEYDVPSKDSQRMAPAQVFMSGHHYFLESTPTFDVTTKRGSYGYLQCKKDASSPPPADSVKGQHGEGYGSVPWLKLSDAGGSNIFKEVYRLNTAGGNPPPSCENQPKTFEIQYAAE